MFMRRLAIALLGSAFLSVPSQPALQLPMSFSWSTSTTSPGRRTKQPGPWERPPKHKGHAKHRKARSRRRRHHLSGRN